jgi:ankyrin repeat protein
MKAAQEGNTDIVRHLLFIGADPQYRIEITNSLYSGWSPMTVAARHGFFEIVLLLITASGDMNMQSGSGDTALILATAWGHESTVQLLVSSGANPNLKNENGTTALITAARENNPSLVEILLQYGANVDDQTNWGRTALMYAADHDSARCVKQLLLAGADPNIEDGADNKAIDFASSLSVKKIFENWPLTMQMIVLNELKVDWCVDWDFWLDLREYEGSS